MSNRTARITVTTGLSAALVLLAVFGIFTVYSFSSVAGDVVKASAIERVEPTPESSIPNGLEQVNSYRASKGLGPVSLDAQLNVSAQAKAIDMVDGQYFAHFHNDETPWQFIESAGYDYTRAGENLAKCFDNRSDIVDAWIASPKHEEVLTGNYENIGFGIKTSSDGCEYVVAHFGSRG